MRVVAFLLLLLEIGLGFIYGFGSQFDTRAAFYPTTQDNSSIVIYKGESYEGNVHLITTLGSAADLAYFWLHSPIALLSNFFLNEQNKQKT